MGKVTIEDISRETGLSRGTVSRALNDRPDISAKTKRRVLEACRKLNYVPSYAARSLATGRRYAIAVIINSLTDPYDAEFARGVIAQGEAEHYTAHFVELAAEGASPQDRLRRIAADRIDGVIVAIDLEPAAAETLRRRIGRLTVVSRSAIADVECDRFGSDFREVGRLVGRFLLTEGAASSMYIDLPGEGRAARRSGCEEVLGASGVDPDAVIVSAESADDLESVVAARAERVKAIAVSNDCAAVTVMLALSRLGRAPGRDVSVLGQGNYPFARRIRPALSTIDPCGYDVGRRAMEALMQRLSKQRMSAPEETLIAPRVVARDTARVGF